jgi:hypothetical protein
MVCKEPAKFTKDLPKASKECPKASKEWLRASKKHIGEEAELPYKRVKTAKSTSKSTIKCNSLSFSSYPCS